MEISSLESMIMIVLSLVGVVHAYYSRQVSQLRNQLSELKKEHYDLKARHDQLESNYNHLVEGCMDSEHCQTNYNKVLRAMDKLSFRITYLYQLIQQFTTKKS